MNRLFSSVSVMVIVGLLAAEMVPKLMSGDFWRSDRDGMQRKSERSLGLSDTGPRLIPPGDQRGGAFSWVAKPVPPDPDASECNLVANNETFVPTIRNNEPLYVVPENGRYLIQFQATYEMVRTDGSVQFIREQNMEGTNRMYFVTMDADGLQQPDGLGRWKVWRAGIGKPVALRPPFPDKNYGAGIVWISKKAFYVGSGRIFPLKVGHRIIPDINVYRDDAAYAARTGRLAVRVFKCPEQLRSGSFP